MSQSSRGEFPCLQHHFYLFVSQFVHRSLPSIVMLVGASRKGYSMQQFHNCWRFASYPQRLVNTCLGRIWARLRWHLSVGWILEISALPSCTRNAESLKAIRSYRVLVVFAGFTPDETGCRLYWVDVEAGL